MQMQLWFSPIESFSIHACMTSDLFWLFWIMHMSAKSFPCCFSWLLDKDFKYYTTVQISKEHQEPKLGKKTFIQLINAVQKFQNPNDNA